MGCMAMLHITSQPARQQPAGQAFLVLRPKLRVLCMQVATSSAQASAAVSGQGQAVQLQAAGVALTCKICNVDCGTSSGLLK